jgi:HSP20 family protein
MNATPTKRFLVPAVDVFESDEAWRLVADLPRADKESLEVTVHESKLKIRADAPQAVFERTFRLPAHVRGDHVTASLDGGVLTLDIPKPEEARPHRVAVA